MGVGAHHPAFQPKEVLMSGVRSLKRGPTLVGFAEGTSAPIYVDDGSVTAANANKILFQPEGPSANPVTHTVFDDGGVAALFSGVTTQRVTKWVTLALTGAAVHAAAVGIVNPEATDVLVTEVVLDLTTHATAANGSIDVGYTATSISTASATIQDGILVGSGVTVPVLYPTTTPKVYWPAGKWITVSDDGTADVTGMVAKLYISYILL